MQVVAKTKLIKAKIMIASQTDCSLQLLQCAYESICAILNATYLSCREIEIGSNCSCLATYLRDWSGRGRRVSVRARRTRSERGHALGHPVSQNELFAELDVGASLGCMRAASGAGHKQGGLGRGKRNRSVIG